MRLEAHPLIAFSAITISVQVNCAASLQLFPSIMAAVFPLLWQLFSL